MKKIIIFIILVICSCATFKNLSEEFYPLHLRLISSDEKIKSVAFTEYSRLGEHDKLKIQLKIVELLATEEAPDIRIKILNTLQELKVNFDIVIPLIYNVSKNNSIKEYKEIIYFLMNIKPDKKGVEKLIELLKKEDKWEVRFLAMTSLVSNPEESSKAIPEMVGTMKKYILDKDKYFKTFDMISMINPEISILFLIKDLKDENKEVRKNIFEKLIELQVFLSSKIEVKKEILPAIIRGLYDEDNNISKMALDTLKEINDPVAKETLEAYLNMGKTLFDSFMKLTEKNLQDFFKAQDIRIEKRIKEIYKNIGREDAVK